MAQVTTATIGYPRIGEKRKQKFALENFWKGKVSEEELEKTAYEVEDSIWTYQKSAGIKNIGLDGTLYDQILDWIYALGLQPKRFKDLKGLELYFAMARGVEGIPALDMSKFFDTNYHYLVPELAENFSPSPNFDGFLDKVKRGQKAVGKEAAIPMIIGPITLIALAKSELPLSKAVSRLVPTYSQLLQELKKLQVPEVQLHEPVLATDQGAQLKGDFEAVYKELSGAGVPIDLTTYYDDIGSAYSWVVKLPVASISLDFCGVPGAAARNETLNLIKQHGFPADKRLGAGVIDGRAPWADDGTAVAILSDLLSLGVKKIAVQASVSLQHLPLDLNDETKLPKEIISKLSFAQQKITEIVELAKQLEGGLKGQAGLGSLDLEKGVPKDLDEAMFSRSEPYEKRRPKQIATRPFPTSSIGSFPQTPELRRLRMQYKKGGITEEAYLAGVDAYIAYSIGLQDGLDVDVPVHGEPERTDMVEYFAEKLEGICFTENGWVQSYGSRYTRPPILYSDIKFLGPMTIREFKVAQTCTPRPVKGMLTGPVTILNWSFPRKDISRKAQAYQLALAIRQEVAALEEASCRVIQVDEPALREGLPLKRDRWQGYLDWAVKAFRLSINVAKPETQMVTHLCYSQFEDIFDAVDAMDADVLTIENSRSGDGMIRALADFKYSRDLGAGVYDVHSPVVPTIDFLTSKVETFMATNILKGRTEHMWLNPDCGLKTRTWAEVIPSLRNMSLAALELRKKYGDKNGSAPVANHAS